MTFEEIADPLVNDPLYQKLKTQGHHRNVNRYDHSVHVAESSYKIAKKLGLDADSCARAGLLHDLFFNRTKDSYDKKIHMPPAYYYPEDALENAQTLTELNDKEKNIILSHMWPLSLHLPRSREAWLIALVDKGVAISDLFQGKSDSESKSKAKKKTRPASR